VSCAAARRGQLFAGAGVTFSGPDVSQVNGHGMGAALWRFSPSVGARLDAPYTLADGDDLLG